MIGVSNSAPRLPVLVSVKVPPPSSSGRDLVRAGPLGQVGDLARDPAEAEVAGVVDDRHQQPALGVHRDAEVLGVVVGDRAGLLVDRGVHRRVRLERLDGGLGEERQERELDALAGLEVLLRLLPQVRDPGDVGLDDGGQLGADLQRLDHPPGDDRRAAGTSSPCGRAPRCPAWRPGTGSAARRRRREPARRRRGLLGRGEHVLLADPAADAGARDASPGRRRWSAASRRTSGVTYAPPPSPEGCCAAGACGATCGGGAERRATAPAARRWRRSRRRAGRRGGGGLGLGAACGSCSAGASCCGASCCGACCRGLLLGGGAARSRRRPSRCR